MVVELEIRGEDLHRLTRALREAADDLPHDLEHEIAKAAEHTGDRMRATIPGALPRGGGLAGLVAADATFDVGTRRTGDRVEVSIEARSRYNLARMNDSGSFSHPVYGDMSDWVEQSAGVRRGFLDAPFRDDADAFERAALEAVADIRTTIERGL